MLKRERIQADEIDDDGQHIFEATFQVDGPNAKAEIEITVSDYVDDANVVSIALHTLHVSMREWARATENRRIAARDADELAGD